MTSQYDQSKGAAMDNTLTLPASEFKARCLALMDQVHSGRLQKVVITKRGKTIAELQAPTPVPLPTLYGALEGLISVPAGADLTTPAFDEDWDAQKT